MGFDVISVHRTDGSSLCVQLLDGTFRYFESKQACWDESDVRATEILSAYEWYCSSRTDPNPGHDNDADAGFIAAGVALGAATAARVVDLGANRKNHRCRGAIFLGGVFPWPLQAFHNSDLFENLPCLSVQSEYVSKCFIVFCATKMLAGRHPVHVLPNTSHKNFCGVIFWFPTFLLRRVLGDRLGNADAYGAYQDIVRLTRNFLSQNFLKSKAIRSTC
jgi:hypothetical protein